MFTKEEDLHETGILVRGDIRLIIYGEIIPWKEEDFEQSAEWIMSNPRTMIKTKERQLSFLRQTYALWASSFSNSSSKNGVRSIQAEKKSNKEDQEDVCYCCHNENNPHKLFWPLSCGHRVCINCRHQMLRRNPRAECPIRCGILLDFV